MRPSPPKRPRPRPDPNIRVTPRGVIIDGIDQYARALVGEPPADFKELLGCCLELNPVVAEICGVDEKEERTAEQKRADNNRMRDTLLLAAWAITETCNEGEGENPLAFVQRAKQVIGWCQPKTQELTVLAVLENKAREIARLIGQRLARHEGFILTMFDHGIDEDRKGSSSWISSVDRRQAIAMLGETLEAIKADQAQHS